MSTSNVTDCNDEPVNKMLYGFGLSTAAGLMTMLGGATVYFPIPRRHLRLSSCFCLATASGVMAYVSLVEVFGESRENFTESLHSQKDEKTAETLGLLYASCSFFLGWFIAIAMDTALHRFIGHSGSCSDSSKNPQSSAYQPGAIEDPDVSASEQLTASCCDEEVQAQLKFETDTFRIMRVGWFTALALTLHNIPEGLLTYVSALSENPTVGLGIACAIGLHNIPEGFAVAFPIKIGTGSKPKALMYAAITGLAEPVGALIGYLLFGDNSDGSKSDSNKFMFGCLFGITAGIMTEVAIKSLLIESTRYDPVDRIVSKAWIFGAFIIAASLVVIDATAPAGTICESNKTHTFNQTHISINATSSSIDAAVHVNA